jgi:hypothetical protein
MTKDAAAAAAGDRLTHDLSTFARQEEQIGGWHQLRRRATRRGQDYIDLLCVAEDSADAGKRQMCWWNFNDGDSIQGIIPLLFSLPRVVVLSTSGGGGGGGGGRDAPGGAKVQWLHSDDKLAAVSAESVACTHSLRQ